MSAGQVARTVPQLTAVAGWTGLHHVWDADEPVHEPWRLWQGLLHAGAAAPSHVWTLHRSPVGWGRRPVGTRAAGPAARRSRPAAVAAAAAASEGARAAA